MGEMGELLLGSHEWEPTVGKLGLNGSEGNILRLHRSRSSELGYVFAIAPSVSDNRILVIEVSLIKGATPTNVDQAAAQASIQAGVHSTLFSDDSTKRRLTLGSFILLPGPLSKLLLFKGP